eukprot:1157284-Pelagomonas_calceolata.AAC.3
MCTILLPQNEDACIRSRHKTQKGIPIGSLGQECWSPWSSQNEDRCSRNQQTTHKGSPSGREGQGCWSPGHHKTRIGAAGPSK